jgi:sec-independent protein translocase protein TatA
MFGSLGMPELIVIGVLALIAFGPRKRPEFGKALGDALRGFKRGVTENDKPPLEGSHDMNKDASKE